MTNTLPTGYRTFHDTSPSAYIANRIRIAVLRVRGEDGSEVWAPGRDCWMPVPPAHDLDEEAWALDVPEPIALALYSALRHYYGDGDLPSVKALDDARRAAEARADALQAAIISIAVGATARTVPALPLLPGHTPGMRKPTRDDYMPRGVAQHVGELPSEGFEGGI